MARDTLLSRNGSLGKREESLLNILRTPDTTIPIFKVKKVKLEAVELTCPGNT